MNPSSHSAEKKYHLDGIKGLLCYFIMFGHFWHVYYGIRGDAPIKHPFFDTIRAWPLGRHILSATFWLYAFLVISGYLLSFSQIRSFKALIVKSASRFLRLYLPILGAVFFVYAIQSVIGFHVVSTKDYFSNSWFQQYYQAEMTLKEMILDSLNTMLHPACKFNPPFWVISDMLKASWMMYLCQYTDRLFKKKTHLLLWAFFGAAIIHDHQIVVACLCGFMLGYYSSFFKHISRNIPILLLLSILSLGLFRIIKGYKLFPRTFDYILLYTLLYCILLLWIERIPFIQKLFSSPILLLMSKTSFGVYALHWPIICSIGSLCLIKGIQINLDARIIYLSALCVSLVCTMILSSIYHLTVEKTVTKLIWRLRA